nr:immunoglobulin light chain junction region [Macaca mulatta]MPO13775.1 immunoglobulin light chain junction region [Macaca mulatta]
CSTWDNSLSTHLF